MSEPITSSDLSGIEKNFFITERSNLEKTIIQFSHFVTGQLKPNTSIFQYRTCHDWTRPAKAVAICGRLLLEVPSPESLPSKTISDANQCYTDTLIQLNTDILTQEWGKMVEYFKKLTACKHTLNSFSKYKNPQLKNTPLISPLSIDQWKIYKENLVIIEESINQIEKNREQILQILDEPKTPNSFQEFKEGIDGETEPLLLEDPYLNALNKEILNPPSSINTSQMIIDPSTQSTDIPSFASEQSTTPHQTPLENNKPLKTESEESSSSPHRSYSSVLKILAGMAVLIFVVKIKSMWPTIAKAIRRYRRGL